MTRRTHTLEVGAAAAGQRLDLFVGEALGLSRARLKRLFEAGAVRLEGRAARKGASVAAGQRVTVELEDEAPRAAQPDTGWTLPVLHVDPCLVFVDKPAGRPSHPLEPGETGTVANALVALYPECAAASADAREGGLCHRLDVDTSGVLVAARTREAWERLRAAFSGRGQVDKAYLALVSGPLADEGDIDLALRHHPRHADRMEPVLETGGEAREARSRFRVLARSGGHSLVEVHILTGVHHQVRAHLAAVGAPIVADALYGGREEAGLARFFLHARSLGLAHPVTGERLHVESALPAELRAVLERHGLPSPAPGPTPPSP